ncbi:TonB family protein [Simiduia curdlanivorans]|uniref:TonB family protein n=1 Tax=Simiduia curdlanivorans TaxID=1492769 RepID=A0ABV8V855_9GAMM|nr:TonB family protein [Simiduia curdlanivorans]MDN3638576.1 TonB family protein [Simiduia curdlanivorans]
MTICLNRWLIAVTASLIFSLAQAEPTLNGIAPYSKLGQEQFLAGLYLPATTADVAAAMTKSGERRIELRITASDVSSRGLSRMWIEGMAINIAGDTLQNNADGMVEFTKIVKGRLQAGDTITVDDMPNEGISVAINGVNVAKIRRAPDLFNMLLSTWIGSVPLSSDFRDRIMASGNIDANLLSRFRATQPTTDRVADVKEWAAPKPAAIAAAATVVAAAPTPSAPKPSVSAPTIQAPSIAAAPKIDKPEPEVAKPEPAAAKPAPAKPTPKPTQVATVKTANNAFLDDDELDEEEEPLLTAASLVSRQLYHSKLLRWTYKNIRYPKRALQREQEGSVRIAVTIDRNGKVLNSMELEGTKYSLLNTEAIKAVERSDPFPPMPQDVLGEKFEFTLPITFSIPKE